MMRIPVVFALIIVGVTSTASAQSDISDIHQSTTTPTDARFEIVQSQLAAKWTFRLDRYKGRIYQLVRTQEGGLTWEIMVVQGLPNVSPTRPRFVIFTSGIAARHTFLMDCDTGQTWVLTSISESVVLWKPFEQ